MKIKKIISSILMVSVFWVSVITPAKAFLPLIALAVEAAYADVAMTTALGLSTAAIGTAIAFIKFKDPSSDNVLVVQINPKSPLETPSGGGWMPPTTTIYPNAPASVPARWQASQRSGSQYPYFSTQVEAAQYYYTSVGSNLVPSCIRMNISTWNCNSSATQVVQTAPSGYTIQEAPANPTLTNNSIATKPAMNRDMMTRVANTIVRDTQQAASDNVSTNSRAVTVTTNSVKATNPATGETTTITINSSDGTTTVITTTPNADGTTSTVKTTYMSSPDSTTGNVYVTGQKTETVQGQGSAAGTSSTPGATTSVTVDTSALETKVDAAANQAHSDSVAEQAKIDQLKNGQCGGTGQPSCKIDETGTPVTGPQSQSDLSTSMSTYAADATSGIDGYVAPTESPAESPLSNLQGGTCSPIVTGGWGAVPGMSLDPCPMVDVLRPMVEWMLYILAALYLWFRFNSVQSGVSE